MSNVKRDSLGRRIPQFDRTKAAVKGEHTKKEKYGSDFHARAGAMGGRARKRGYFGYLVDEGKLDELKQVSARGGRNSRSAKEKGERVRRFPNQRRKAGE